MVFHEIPNCCKTSFVEKLPIHLITTNLQIPVAKMNCLFFWSCAANIHAHWPKIIISKGTVGIWFQLKSNKSCNEKRSICESPTLLIIRINFLRTKTEINDNIRWNEETLKVTMLKGTLMQIWKSAYIFVSIWK